jgi:hypothetical protein
MFIMIFHCCLDIYNRHCFSERIQAEIDRRKQAEQEREVMQKRVIDLERSAEEARRGTN